MFSMYTFKKNVRFFSFKLQSTNIEFGQLIQCWYVHSLSVWMYAWPIKWLSTGLSTKFFITLLHKRPKHPGWMPVELQPEDSSYEINKKTTEDIKGLNLIDLKYYYFKINLKKKLCGKTSTYFITPQPAITSAMILLK